MRTLILAIIALVWLIVVHRITGVLNSLTLLGVYILFFKIIMPSTARSMGRIVHRQRPYTTENERGENPIET